MKKGEKMSEEHKAKMLEAARVARENRAKNPPAPIQGEKPAAAPVVANGHGNLLDIADPMKWQMKIRLHLEKLDMGETDDWMNALRVIYQMAGTVARDVVYRRATGRCFICGKPFPEGRPAGEAGYYDADRQYIKVYCCHNAEYSNLLLKCQEKEQAVAAWQEKADKAARQAMIDARSAARKEMPA